MMPFFMLTEEQILIAKKYLKYGFKVKRFERIGPLRMQDFWNHKLDKLKLKHGATWLKELRKEYINYLSNPH